MDRNQDVLTTTTEIQSAVRRTELENQRRSGSSWFYWVAGLSVINSAVLLFGGTWTFVFGLGLTQVIDAIGLSGSPEGTTALPVGAFVVDLVVAGGVAIIGYFAQRGQTSAYVVGMSLYALDAVVFAVAGDYLALGFHGFALWGMWRGLSAQRELARLALNAERHSAVEGGAA